MPSVASPVLSLGEQPQEIAGQVREILTKFVVENSEIQSLEKSDLVKRSICQVQNKDGVRACGYLCKMPLRNDKVQLVGIVTNPRVLAPETLKSEEFSFDLLFENCPPFTVSQSDISWKYSDKGLEIVFVQLTPNCLTRLMEMKAMKPLEMMMKRFSQDQDIAVVRYPSFEENQKIEEMQGANFRHDVGSMTVEHVGAPLFEKTNWYVVGVCRGKMIEEQEMFDWAVSGSVLARKTIKKWRRLLPRNTQRNKSEERRPRSKASGASSTVADGDEIGQAIEGFYAPKLHKTAQAGSVGGVKDVVRKFHEEFGDGHALRLIDHHNSKNQSRTAVSEAAQQGSLKVVKYLVQDCGADLFEHDSSDLRLTAIHLAAEEGHYDVVQFLLQMEPELLEFGDKFGDSVLAMAAFGGQLRIVEFLVEKKKANLENKGELGRTPLMRAAVNGHLPVVKYLVKKGANVEARDSTRHRNTTMHLAAYFNHSGVVGFLAQHKPGLIKMKNGMQRLPLYYAKLPVSKQDVISLLEQAK